MYIYVDESGDLGFTKKSGSFFVVALVKINNPKQVEIWMRRIKSRKLSKKERKLNEAKAAIASEKLKEYFYNHFSDLDFRINLIIINKTKIPSRIKREQGLIYLHMIKEGMTKLVKNNNEPILITIDRRHFQKLTKEAFNTSLKEYLIIHCGSKSQINIHHIDSATNNILQFVDFIVYAVGKKYNTDDLHWYNYLKKFIIEETIIKLTDKK